MQAGQFDGAGVRYLAAGAAGGGQGVDLVNARGRLLAEKQILRLFAWHMKREHFGDIDDRAAADCDQAANAGGQILANGVYHIGRRLALSVGLDKECAARQGEGTYKFVIEKFVRKDKIVSIDPFAFHKVLQRILIDDISVHFKFFHLLDSLLSV